MNEAPTTPNTTPEALEAEQVLRLPGHLFFVESVELPPALEAEEIADFAELTVESIAPFPIDQLNWGFLYTDDATTLLIYAAHRDRLKKCAGDQLETYAWVQPDFASLVGARFPEATEIALVAEDCLTIAHFETGAEAPYAILSHPFDHDDNLATAIKALSAEIENSPTIYKKLVIRLVDTEVNEQGLPTFHFAELDGTAHTDYGHWSSLSPSEKTLWQADIRSAAFKTSERSARRTSALLTKITAWAALIGLLLILMEGILFGANMWSASKQKRISQQQPAVARIEDQQTLMNKLEQVAQNELRPIAILEALNQARPDGIYFTSTDAEGENRITIDGIANTINDLNRYTESLSRSGNFELIGTPKSITRSGTTTFSATLDYKHREEVPPTTPEDAPPQGSDVEGTTEPLEEDAT